MADSSGEKTDEKPQQTPQPDRRMAIAGIAALVAGALAKASERAAEATTGAPLLLDQTNLAQDTTRLERVPLQPGFVSGPAFQVDAVGGGPAILGTAGPMAFTGAIPTLTSDIGLGAVGSPAMVAATGQDPVMLQQALDVAGDLRAGLVVLNVDTDRPALLAFQGPVATPETVTVTATVPAAVLGLALEPQSLGGFFQHLDGGTALVAAQGPFAELPFVPTPTAVLPAGFFQSGGGGLALETVGDVVIHGNLMVSGATQPASSGEGTIPADQEFFEVQDPFVDPNSIVLIMFKDPPTRGVAVSHIELFLHLFRIVLTRASRVPITFKYVAFRC